MKIDKIIPELVCPESKEKLFFDNNCLKSPDGKTYQFTDGKPDFIGVEKNYELSLKRDFIDKMKYYAKDLLGVIYVIFVYVISPVMPRIHWRSLQIYWKYVAKKYSKDKRVVIQIGSGNDRINEDIINIDIFNFQEVDIIADCTKLPFADNSIDGVFSLAVLEHVSNPGDFLKEAFRIIKPGGFIFTGVPFMLGFHASPSDYTRWTHEGLASWHKQNGFVKERVESIAGPTSSFLWILQEWISIFLSFGLNPLYYFWWTVFTITLFPLKILDLFLIYFPQSYKINSFNIYIGKKLD